MASATAEWVAGPFLQWTQVGQRTVASAEGPFIRLISSGDDGESHVSRFFLVLVFITLQPELGIVRINNLVDCWFPSLKPFSNGLEPAW